jgi:predicted porin
MIAAFGITSAFASPEIDVYGRINVTLQNSDEAVEEQVELKSNSSRVGVKGEKALNSDLKAIYQLEWGVNVDSESDDDIFTPRNQFVGLEGAFGTVKVGRHDTALKESQGDFRPVQRSRGRHRRNFQRREPAQGLHRLHHACSRQVIPRHRKFLSG